jgi:hypothetical protein
MISKGNEQELHDIAVELTASAGAFNYGLAIWVSTGSDRGLLEVIDKVGGVVDRARQLSGGGVVVPFPGGDDAA